MAALARPTRIVRGKNITQSSGADPTLFELPEESALFDALSIVAAEVTPEMPLATFLEVGSRWS